MLIIRLIRTGKKNSSSFRLILTERKTPPRGGKFLEILGSYNPRQTAKKGKIDLKKERIEYWLSQGVKTSDTVHNLLVSQGIIKGPKIKKKLNLSRGKKKKQEAGKKEEKTEESVEEKPEKEEKPEEKEPVKEEKASSEEKKEAE